MKQFLDVRFRVNVTDEDAFAEARHRLTKMCQNETIKQEIAETLRPIGLDVEDVCVVATRRK